MNKIKSLLIGFFILFVSSSNLVFADSDHAELNIGDTIGQIQEAQQVDSLEKINCDKITDEQLEKLGETFMAIIHPDPRQHELMDQMMGGEGSEPLKAAHIMMGSRYLGCTSGMGMMGGQSDSMPMMGGGMMDFWDDDGFESMGGGMMRDSMWGRDMGGMSSTWGFWMFYVMKFLIWALVIVGIIFLIRFFMRKGESSLEILKRRYAKGEINKKEFETMKKDLS